MKKLWILIILLPAVLCFISCEKDNDDANLSNLTKNYNEKYEQTGNPYDYVIVNADWQLVDAKHKDEFGNIGELYVNQNNPIETFFLIKEESKICAKYHGVWDTVYIYDEATDSMQSVQTCKVANENENCGCMICTEGTTLVSVSMWGLKK